MGLSAIRQRRPKERSIQFSAAYFSSRKGQWLLALLILRHGREIQRGWLAGTLWPDSPEDRAYGSLRISLNDLRRALGAEAHRLRSCSPARRDPCCTVMRHRAPDRWTCLLAVAPRGGAVRPIGFVRRLCDVMLRRLEEWIAR